MSELVTNRDKVAKHYVVSVPNTVKVAKVELLVFRGAPAFLGTKIAKLYFDNNKSIILYSKMSGVVNRILVENNEMVSSGQRLVELRNTNTSRTRTGNKMQPSRLPVPKPSNNSFKIQKKQNTNWLASNITAVSQNLLPPLLIAAPLAKSQTILKAEQFTPAINADHRSDKIAQRNHKVRLIKY